MVFCWVLLVLVGLGVDCCVYCVLGSGLGFCFVFLVWLVVGLVGGDC